MVDLRMNILNDDVDYFVISESTLTHQGQNKKLNFDIDNFKNLKKRLFIPLLSTMKIIKLLIIKEESLLSNNIKEIIFYVD